MTNKAEDTKRILVALDLTHQSGREHLAGFYSFADKKSNWEIRLVPSTEPSYLPLVERFLSEGVDGAIIKGECVRPLAGAIRRAGIPVVAIDRPHSQKEDVADIYVCNDNELVGRSAAQFFDSLGRFASYGFVPDPNNCEWSRTRGKAFLGACAAKHRTAKTSTANGDLAEWLTALPKPAAQLVRNIIAYLDEHALEPIRVSDVVEHAGVSPRLANLRFSQTRGHSIQEEIVVRRLKEARRLLSGTKWSMKRIAERCGFKSQIVLAHLFSSRFGKSMRQWRIDTRTGPA